MYATLFYAIVVDGGDRTGANCAGYGGGGVGYIKK